MVTDFYDSHGELLKLFEAYDRCTIAPPGNYKEILTCKGIVRFTSFGNGIVGIDIKKYIPKSVSLNAKDNKEITYNLSLNQMRDLIVAKDNLDKVVEYAKKHNL